MRLGRGRAAWPGAAAAVVTAGLLAAGCGPQTPPSPDIPPAVPGTPTAGTPGTSGTPTTPGSAPSPTPSSAPSAKSAPRADEVLIEVNVSGGLAGVANQLLVYGDGRWTLRQGTRSPRTREGQMKPAELAELRAALDSPAYAAVPARPGGGTVHDGFQYVISHDHRVVVAGDMNRPQALDRVFAALPEGGPPTSK